MLEIPKAELGLVEEILPQIMTKMDEGKLKIPLVTGAGAGMSWEKAH